MACSGRFAEAEDFARVFCVDTPLSPEESSSIETILDIAASDIHAALAASDQCSCSFATWANTLLMRLNCTNAAVIYNCTCGRAKLTDEARQMWLNWMSTQLTAIRLGELELCQGETSTSYPARASAEIGHTDWSSAEIIWHAEERALVP